MAHAMYLSESFQFHHFKKMIAITNDASKSEDVGEGKQRRARDSWQRKKVFKHYKHLNTSGKEKVKK